MKTDPVITFMLWFIITWSFVAFFPLVSLSSRGINLNFLTILFDSFCWWYYFLFKRQRICHKSHERFWYLFCEIAGIGILKGVSLELCGMECIDLTKNSVKILDIHFSYNKKTENEENFIKIIKKIENVLKIWTIRNLATQVKITI